MAELERFSSAIAILVGFAGLGVVLHSGLASIAMAVGGYTAQSPASSGPSPRSPSVAPDSPPRSPPPASAPADSAAVQRDRAIRFDALTLSALVPQQATYAAACFRIQQMPMPLWVRVDVTFDGQGRELSRELAPEPGTELSFVECLRKVKQPALTIEAPGQVTRVTTRITVP